MENSSGYKKVCVIVPVRSLDNRSHRCFDSLPNLDYPNFEIIIVDDGLSDASLQALRQYGNEKVKILNSGRKGPSYARNLGATHTDAWFLAFTDSDCIVDRNWLRELMRGFDNYPQAAACGGIQKLPQDASIFEKRVFLFMTKTGFITEYMRQAGQNIISEVRHNASCCVMYRRDIFLKEGGFQEGLWPGEDVEFDYRLTKKGYKLFFNPGAIVYHYRPNTLKAFSKMMYNYGYAQGRLVKQYGLFRKLHLVPFLYPIIFLAVAIVCGVNYLVIFLGVIAILSLCFFNFLPFILFLAFLSFILWNIGFYGGLIFLKRGIS